MRMKDDTTTAETLFLQTESLALSTGMPFHSQNNLARAGNSATKGDEIIYVKPGHGEFVAIYNKNLGKGKHEITLLDGKKAKVSSEHLELFSYHPN
jgi:hypothetical protein